MARTRREHILSGSLQQKDRWAPAPLSFIVPPLLAEGSGVAYLEFSSPLAVKSNATGLPPSGRCSLHWRLSKGAQSFLISGVKYPFYSIKIKGLGWSKAHFPFTFLVLASVSGMLCIFLLSLLLYIFSFKKVKRKLGGSFSPELKNKMLSHVHPSVPQRQWGKEVSCQQMVW